MQHYIFLVSDQTVGTAKQSANEIFTKLVIEHNIWGVGPRTANRKHLSPGDKAIFYLAGPNNQTFVGAATLASSAYENEVSRASLFVDNTTFRIDLTEVTPFSKPIPRRSVLGLEWAPVMNGTSRISAEDYQRILNADGLAPAISSLPIAHEGEDTASFYLERYLEDFIVDNWSSIFGNTLTIYTDKDNNIGRQYYTQEVGYIDILAQDKQGNFIMDPIIWTVKRSRIKSQESHAKTI
jgi:hypothetical protein